jgi:hypothetical protein
MGVGEIMLPELFWTLRPSTPPGGLVKAEIHARIAGTAWQVAPLLRRVVRQEKRVVDQWLKLIDDGLNSPQPGFADKCLVAIVPLSFLSLHASCDRNHIVKNCLRLMSGSCQIDAFFKLIHSKLIDVYIDSTRSKRFLSVF